MPLASTLQDDFGAGLYRGRKAPANSAYDLVNCLINDEGLPFRRGGDAYHSTSDAAADLEQMIVGYMRAVAANRVLISPAANTYVLDGSKAPVALGTILPIRSRPAIVGNFLAYLGAPTTMLLYGGSLKSAQYTTGTVTVTNGSAAIVGAGTSWAANVDAGMIFAVGSDIAVVKTVTDDTHITLTDPWPGATAAGAVYELDVQAFSFLFGYGASRGYVAAAGSGSPRLLYCIGNRVYFSARGNPFDSPETDYHETPANAVIVGAEGRGDSVLIFTTDGIWAIDNLGLDAVDDYGNIQHTVSQVNKDVILWDDYGLAGYAGRTVIPAIDDVFLMGPDSIKPITGSIRPLYREYVDAGYQLGMAAVHRGHYFLPIMNGTTLVDTLVCRLDRENAWTRWAGHASGAAYATLIGDATREPKLLGISGKRVTDLTGCFDPTATNAQDADGTTSDLELITSDFPTGRNQPGFAQRVRLRYEMEQGQQTDDFDGTGPLTAPWVDYTATVPDAAGGTVQPDSYSDALRDTVMQADGSVTLILDPPLAPNGALYSLGVLIRVDGILSTSDGYAFDATDTGTTWQFKLYKDSGFTLLGTSVTTTTAAIDGIRITATGTTIKGYVRAAGLDWAEVISVTDSSHAAGGRPGFYLQDFGAGHDLQATSFAWGPLPATTSVEFSSDADDGEWTELTERGEQGGGDGWAESDGSLYQWALVAKRRERVRFRLKVMGATASFLLRSFETLTRPSGKQ